MKLRTATNSNYLSTTLFNLQKVIFLLCGINPNRMEEELQLDLQTDGIMHACLTHTYPPTHNKRDKRLTHTRSRGTS